MKKLTQGSDVGITDFFEWIGITDSFRISTAYWESRSCVTRDIFNVSSSQSCLAIPLKSCSSNASSSPDTIPTTAISSRRRALSFSPCQTKFSQCRVWLSSNLRSNALTGWVRVRWRVSQGRLYLEPPSSVCSGYPGWNCLYRALTFGPQWSKHHAARLGTAAYMNGLTQKDNFLTMALDNEKIAGIREGMSSSGIF